jgi:hypothetical protein
MLKLVVLVSELVPVPPQPRTATRSLARDHHDPAPQTEGTQGRAAAPRRAAPVKPQNPGMPCQARPGSGASSRVTVPSISP